MEVFNDMRDAVVRGDSQGCIDLATKALESGVDPLQAIEEGFAPGMAIVGQGFEEGTYYLPDMMLAADAMKAGVAVLEAALPIAEAGGATKPKVVLATIQGDVHEIGKNILRTILSTSGFDVVDLGRDVKVATIIDRARAERADIIGVSALMTTTMMYMKTLIEELSETGIRGDFKVMVGGAPVTEDWAREIGADGYGKDAFSAIQVARNLVGQ